VHIQSVHEDEDEYQSSNEGRRELAMSYEGMNQDKEDEYQTSSEERRKRYSFDRS